MALSGPEQRALDKANERRDATLVTTAQFDAFEADRKKMSEFRVPDFTKSIVDSGAASDKTQIKVFTAFFDGTGNDGHKDPQGATNVFYMYTQGRDAVDRGNAPHTAVHYMAGPGTGVDNQFTEQDQKEIAAGRAAVRLARVPEVDPLGGVSARLVTMKAAAANGWQSLSDGVKTSPRMNDLMDMKSGWSADSRANTMYQRLCEQTQTWERDVPAGEKIKVVVSAYGFSRGAETAAVFVNKVEKNGIRNPTDFLPLADSVDKYGQRELKFQSHPVYLAQPGKTPQTIGLFDPVGTGHLSEMNRQMPPSVVSGTQINALDEKRRAFPVSTIVPGDAENTRENVSGISQDGRFFRLWAPGSHSDVGGSYACNGLSNRSGNAMISYQNALNPALSMQLRDEPASADCYIHHSYNGNALFKAQYVILGPVGRDTAQGQNTKINPADVSAKAPLPMNEDLFKPFREGRASSVTVSQGAQLRPESETSRLQSRASADPMSALFSAATAGSARQSTQLLRDAVDTPLNPAIAARVQGAQDLRKAQQVRQTSSASRSQHDTPPTSPVLPGQQR